MDAKIKNTADQLARQVECAKKVGIYDSMFLAFGSLLGYIREGTIISHDDDMDIGIMADNITIEQQHEYVQAMGESCKAFPNHGLFEYRREMTRRQDNGGLFWVSIRGRPVGQCYKCCHWFFWTQQGYTWHSKGPGSYVKGAPVEYFGMGPEVNFLGVKIRIPKMSGALMDFWYTDWFMPRVGGNSARKVLMTDVNWTIMKGKMQINSE